MKQSTVGFPINVNILATSEEAKLRHEKSIDRTEPFSA